MKPVYIVSDEKLRIGEVGAKKYKTKGKPLNLITTVVLKYLRFYVSAHIDLLLFFCVKAIQSWCNSKLSFRQWKSEETC